MGRRRALALTLPAVAAMVALSAGAFGSVTAGAATPAAPAWSATQAGVPSNTATGTKAEATIEASTCPSPGSCIAVGYYRTSAGTETNYQPLVEVYSAGNWNLVTVPLPANAATGTAERGGFFSVSCSGPTTCTAVGTYKHATGHTWGVIVATMSGSTWTATQAPEPTGAGTGTAEEAYLGSVSCPAPGACAAVGGYHNATGQQEGMIDTLSGTTWTATSAPEPTGAGAGTAQYAYLESVSCPASGTCTAVGWYDDATGHEHGLIDTLSGSTWTATLAPEPSGAGTGTHQDGYVESVTCLAGGSCTAVGTYDDATGDSHGLILTGSASTWTATSAPEPSGAGTGTDQDAYLASISCTASGACTAVGTFENSTGRTFGLIVTGSGTTWAAAQAPEPAGAGTGTRQYGYLEAVSCTANGTCTAVGSYQNSTGSYLGQIDTGSGSTWTATQAPEPSGAATGADQDAGLYDVSCVAGGCVAGGTYRASTGGYQGLLETYNMVPTGYFEAASDGGIFAFTVPFYGSMGGKPLNQPIVASAADTLTGGYYEVASDGGIFAFNAPFEGSMGGKPLNEPIVGMAYDTRTGGYYEVASDGGLFAFTAPFYGSMGGKPLNQPIVGVAFDPSTGGYWEVAADGGLFAFNAPFEGSMGGKPLDKPIVGMTFDSLTGGYYEVATDGGLFAFNAPFEGSMGGQPLNEPVVGMAFDFGTGGYYEVATDGGIFAFDAPFDGSMGGKPLNKPIVTLSVL
jgi:hypothetical protein